jgi:hypothetical protein
MLSKVNEGWGIHRHNGDCIGLVSFFQNKESRLKMCLAPKCFCYLLNYQVAPLFNSMQQVLDKLIIAQQARKFPTLYGTERQLHKSLPTPRP